MSSLRNISSGRELNLDLFCGIDSTDKILSKKIVMQELILEVIDSGTR
jgi:hypothetical protein